MQPDILSKLSQIEKSVNELREAIRTNPNDEEPKLLLKVDFDSLGVGEFCDLMYGFRSFVARAALIVLFEKQDEFGQPKGPGPYERFQESLKVFAMQNGLSVDFGDYFDESSFNEWLRVVPEFDAVITGFSAGSLLVEMSFAAFSLYTNGFLDVPGTKALTNAVFAKIKELVPKKAPSNTFEGLPQVIKAFGPRLKSFELHKDGDVVDLKVKMID